MKKLLILAVVSALIALVFAPPAGAKVNCKFEGNQFVCAGGAGSGKIPAEDFAGGGGSRIAGDSMGTLEWSGGGGGLTSGSTGGGEPGGLGEHCTTKNGGPAECVGGCSPGAEFLCNTDPAEPAE